MEPNYEDYSLNELIEVKEQIDKTLFPERYEMVSTLIEKKSPKSVKKKEIPEEVFRELYKEQSKEKVHFWPIVRGATSGFIAVKIMQYLEWTMGQMVIGGVIFSLLYLCFLVQLHKIKYERFKAEFRADR